jgi:hypothetical protein
MTGRIGSDDLDRIEIAYESALMVDGHESARLGEHAVLMALLQRLGLPAGSVMEAYATCERVLFGGW